MASPVLIARYVVTKIDGSSNTTMAINLPSEATVGRLGLFKLHCSALLNPNSLTLDAKVSAIANNFSSNGNFVLHSSYSRRVFKGVSDPVDPDPSSFTFTIGADVRDDELVLEIWDGVDTANPIGAIGTFSNPSATSFTTSGLTTTANDSIVLFEIATKDGTVLTAANAGYPTGTTGVASGRTRNNSSGLNSGTAYQAYPTSGTATGTKTWSSYLTSSKYGSTIAYEIKAGASSVSISGAITVASSKAFTTTGLSTVTGVTVATSGGGSVAASFSWAAGSGTLTVPMWSDNSSYPYFGSVIVTVTDGSLTPNTTVTLAIQSGYAEVTFASASILPTYLGNYFNSIGAPILDGDRCYYPTSNNLVIAPNGKISVDQPTTATIAIHRAADKKTYTYNLILKLTSASQVRFSVGLGIALNY